MYCITIQEELQAFLINYLTNQSGMIYIKAEGFSSALYGLSCNRLGFLLHGIVIKIALDQHNGRAFITAAGG